MSQEKFESQIQVRKLKLREHGTKRQGNERLLDTQSIKDEYLKQIKELIDELTQCPDSENNKRSTLLKQIRKTDQLYLDALGVEIKGQVLFTRHGKCTILEQKQLGLNPNAAISEMAQKNMAITNQFTLDLLFNPENKPRIAISPLVRAMQTAALIIPNGIKAAITIEFALSENSSVPSGTDVRSQDDLNKLFKLLFWSSPIKAILFKLSMWFYGEKEFQALNEKREYAAKLIEQRNIGSSQGIREDNQVKQDLNFQKNKIVEIQKLVKDSEEQDIWFIGHGTNFKTFFKQILGIESKFKYGETRRVYKVGGEPTLFVPAYVLGINQETGKIEGRYTGIIGKSLEIGAHHVAHASFPEADSVPKMVTGLGIQRVVIKKSGITIEEAPLLAEENPKNSLDYEENLQKSNELRFD